MRCLVRDPSSPKAKALADAGATLVQGDFANVASLESALVGMDTAFLACSNQNIQVELEINFIAAAARAGLKYLVKLGTCGCEGYCSSDSTIEYGRYHADIEAKLESTESLNWTVLQPNDYMQNHLGDIFGSLPHKALVYPRSTEQLESGAARIVDTRDVGEVAAKLLMLDEGEQRAHYGKKHHVCGPKAWSVSGLGRLYEAALELTAGSIHCVDDMSEGGFADHLEKNAGFPRWLAVAVAKNHIFWAEGKLDYPSADLVEGLHPKFRTMEEWVEEHAPLVKFADQTPLENNDERIILEKTEEATNVRSDRDAQFAGQEGGTSRKTANNCIQRFCLVM